MEIKRLTFNTILSLTVACSLPVMASCGSRQQSVDNGQQSEKRDHKGGKPGGPRLGTPGGGPVIDKTGDPVLQAMIKAEVPEFRQLEYTDTVSGTTMRYNLFTPRNTSGGKQYPLVLFMADASTPGKDYTTPLTQGYGALVWATDQWQSKNPCYVLVPQFSGVAVNDAYEHTDEVDIVIRMLKSLTDENPIDKNRLYTTGQSMGGMISMYYNITYPDVFAASLFVDCHWDTAKFGELATHTFTYVTAGNTGKSFGNIRVLEEAAKADGTRYEYESWSAKLPQSQQDSLATAMLAKGAPINIINFTPKSVLPDDGKGSEHMYSFDYAYKLTPVLEWMFKQSKSGTLTPEH